MFDLLKKKIGGFIGNLVKKSEPKAEEKIVKEEVNVEEKKEEKIIEPEIREDNVEESKQVIVEKPAVQEKSMVKEKTVIEQPKVKIQEKKVEKVEVKKIEKPVSKPEIKKEGPSKIEINEEKIAVKEEKKAVRDIVEKEKTVKVPEFPKIDVKKEIVKEEKKIRLPKIEVKKEIVPPKAKRAEERKEEPKLKMGLVKQVQSIFTGEVEITEGETSELLENLEIELLESDVEIEVADEIKEDLRKAMSGKKVKRSEIGNFAKDIIRNTLIGIVKSEKVFDIFDKVKEYNKPVKILFLGVNGSGKTTTIAKVANMLLKKGYKITLASADTFRSAAIEQMQIHADRLGVKNIKREYGSDPAAVAYDAVNYAKAHEIDVVLVDTAGRQETDLNLINELKKINRVIQPDLKIYIGESIAGNAILNQVEEFNKAVGIDGVILTKLDCDAKGGTFLSITKSTGIPIIYVGTGQKYEDIEKFDAEEIIEKILE